MDVQTVVANVLTFNTNTFVRPALQGFSDADLLKRPSEACNPIGWLFWHQPRVEDLILSHISGRPQTWVAYTWHAQFGRPAGVCSECVYMPCMAYTRLSQPPDYAKLLPFSLASI